MDIYDIELSNRQHGQHFFDADSKRFFRSRIGQDVYEGPGGIFFTTSEQFDHKSPRLYTVRQFNPETGACKTVGEFQQYASSSGARRAAERMAKKAPHDPRR